MASSQAKLTSYFRPTKSNSASAAAAKRRKAVIEDPECVISEIKPVTVTEQSLAKATIEVPTFDATKAELVVPCNFNIFTQGIEVGKSVQKTSSTRTNAKKSVKSSRSSSTTKAPILSKLNLLENAVLMSDKIKEETTSIKDNHDYNPIKISTPKTSSSSTESTRKRKMQCVEQLAEIVEQTPEKIEEKRMEVKTPSKVCKKLDMGSEALNSPSKQVQFLCLGTLSPRKPVTPVKPRASPLTRVLGGHSSEKTIPANLMEKGFKSPAVKSLASLLDKEPASAKLTPEQIKARLGKNKNLAELQAKLSKVNNCSAKVKEFYANQVQLKKFDTVEFNLNIPVSPRKSPYKQSPIKRDTSSVKRPAFERFHALAQPPSPHLVLPYKYKVLNEVFRCLETVVTMLYNRKECIYFNKLKPAVQKMLQRDFTETHLAQVCHVFPSAYKITYEKVMASMQFSPGKNRGFQLTLIPRLDYLSPQLLDEEESSTDSIENQKSFQPLGPSMLIERRYIFHNRLIKLTKQHHTEFLAAHNPMLQVPEDKVTRWHQNFDVDDVPDVPAGNIPLPPEIKTFSTAKDVLEQAHSSLGKVNPRLEAALKERAKLREDATPPKPEVKPEEEPNKPLANAGLKGVSQSLIDKIRAREAAKAQKQMTMNTEEINRQAMSKMLPEMARIINSVYVTEKKSVLPLKSLIERIQYSHKGAMSVSSIEEHVKLLRSVYPQWLEILNRGAIDYVKVDRKIDSNLVYQKLEENAKN